VNFYWRCCVSGNGGVLCGDGRSSIRAPQFVLFAEQSFLNHDKMWRYARISIHCGWGAHLYYWIYPGVMVAVWRTCRVSGADLAELLTPQSGTGVMALKSRWCSPLRWPGLQPRRQRFDVREIVAINVIHIKRAVVVRGDGLGFRAKHPPGSVLINSILPRATLTITNS